MQTGCGIASGARPILYNEGSNKPTIRSVIGKMDASYNLFKIIS